MRFPLLQNALRNILSNEMEKVVREEKFLQDEPDRLESALRRCKKLTGTLVTLKRYVFKKKKRQFFAKMYLISWLNRLASVQEQRLPGTCADLSADEIPRSADSQATNKVHYPFLHILHFMSKFNIITI